MFSCKFFMFRRIAKRFYEGFRRIGAEDVLNKMKRYNPHSYELASFKV